MYTQDENPGGLETLDNTTLANGDLAIVGDISDSNRAKGITWTNIKAFLKTYFDTLYSAAATTIVGITGTTAEFNTALTDNDFATLAGSEALTNKTITNANNNVAAKSLHSATTVVDVVAAAAPSTGQVLMATDSTHATWQTPAGANVNTALTLIPITAEIGFSSSPAALTSVNVNTTMLVGQVIIPFQITANKISIRINAVTTAGTYDLTLYSEDGQTQIFSVTTASLAVSSVIATTALSAVVINPGIYYIAINSNGTASMNTFFWAVGGDGQPPFTLVEGLPFDVASEPVMCGTLTITAGTPPATINTSSITQVLSTTLVFRLDN